MIAAREQADRNPGWNEDQKLLQVDSFAAKHLAKITRTFDNTRNRLVQSITYIEAELTTPIEAQAAGGVAAEVRAHIKGLTTAERMTVIQRAIEEGDHIVSTAVLGAPAMLTGIDANMQKTLTRFYHERQQPEKAKRLKVMQAAKAMIENDASKVFNEMEKAVGGSSSKAKKVREAQAKAEKALAFKDA